MATIPERYPDKLRTAGLLISQVFAPNHKWFPGGVIVSKPTSVVGHSLPEYEARWGNTEITLNAPSLHFHCDGDKSYVTSHDYIPGPGPGDFINVWDTPEDAVEDILDFYFGNPARMDVKREARADVERRLPLWVAWQSAEPDAAADGGA